MCPSEQHVGLYKTTISRLFCVDSIRFSRSPRARWPAALSRADPFGARKYITPPHMPCQRFSGGISEIPLRARQGPQGSASCRPGKPAGRLTCRPYAETRRRDTAQRGIGTWRAEQAQPLHGPASSRSAQSFTVCRAAQGADPTSTNKAVVSPKRTTASFILPCSP